jgi:hypothetical protein
MMCALVIGCFAMLPGLQKEWKVRQPAILPIDVTFNKPLKSFEYGDQTEIVMLPRSDCYLYLFDVDEKNRVIMLYPPYGYSAFVRAGQSRTVDRFGRLILKVNRDKDKLHVVGLISDYPLVRRLDWSRSDPAGKPLTIDGDELAERIKAFAKVDPNKLVHLVMDAPSAQ